LKSYKLKLKIKKIVLTIDKRWYNNVTVRQVLERIDLMGNLKNSNLFSASGCFETAGRFYFFAFWFSGFKELRGTL